MTYDNAPFTGAQFKESVFFETSITISRGMAVVTLVQYMSDLSPIKPNPPNALTE